MSWDAQYITEKVPKSTTEFPNDLALVTSTHFNRRRRPHLRPWPGPLVNLSHYTVRLFLPRQVSMLYVGAFAITLMIVQQLDRTNLYFSLCSFSFVLLAGITFNLAGGFTTPSGGYVFFYSVLGVILGLSWKAVLGEPAQSNLFEPHLTITVFLAGMFAMLISVIVSKRLTRKRPLLSDLSSLSNLQSASTGCLIFSLFIYIIGFHVQHSNGGLFSALIQINRFSELAILLGVTYQIRKSGGRSSVNFPALAATGLLWLEGGLLSFSKQAMFTPLICWVLAAAAQGYRISKTQLLSGALFVVFMIRFMVPYAQYGRSVAADSFTGNLVVSVHLLSTLGSVRDRYLSNERANNAGEHNGYFNTPQGLLERLEMLYPDSTIIEATERLGPYGLYPILADLQNLVPHLFWANKPVIRWGNVFAHETLTPLEEEDESTGISYSPTGEAYRLAKFPGVLFLAPVIWTCTFVWFDSLCGDVRKSPWGLLAITLFAHVAPEGLLDGCIYMMGYGAFAIIVAAFSATHIMPHIGTIFSGPGGRNRFVKTNVRSLPRRVTTLEG